MGRRQLPENARQDRKVEIQALLRDMASQIRTMLGLKDQELTLDHSNDLKSQDVLDLIRKIKLETNQERISAYAHIAETYLMRQIAEDQADDEPWKKERDLLIVFGNKLEQAIQEARKL